MTVNYKGKDNDYDYRIAEFGWDDEDPKDTVLSERVFKLMAIKGYNIDVVADGYALIAVEDKSEYREVVSAYKESKKCIQDCMKFGF